MAATAAALPPFSPFNIITREARADNLNTDQIRVVIARDPATHTGSIIHPEYTKLVLDEAIRRFTTINDAGEAYKSVFPRIDATKVIGIKVNCINYSLPTHPEVVEGLVNGLLEMRFEGQPFPENNIIIWDRNNLDLQSSGYTINTGAEGVRCFGTDAAGGFDTSHPLTCAGTTQYPSRILTEHIDYLIDFAVLKNAGGCGLTMTLKNNYGSISSPSSLHGTYCDPGIPSVNQQIRDELDVTEALFIVDGIFGSYSGGPTGPPNMEYNGVILGQDRVAVDSIGREILAEYGCSTLGNAYHVDTAAEPPYSLGTNDLDEIHLLEVDNPSIPVEDVSIRTRDRDVLVDWASEEYTGYFRVQRCADPAFTGAEEIAVTRDTQFIDRNIVGPAQKYFYRVLKTW